MEINLNTDLSKLSNIPEDILNKLSSLCGYCIGEVIYESQLKNESITQIDLGYGKLLFKNESGVLKSKFIPNDTLEKDIKNVFKGTEPQLQKKLEKSFSDKLIDLYKDII